LRQAALAAAAAASAELAAELRDGEGAARKELEQLAQRADAADARAAAAEAAAAALGRTFAEALADEKVFVVRVGATSQYISKVFLEHTLVFWDIGMSSALSTLI
jgi:hypothetical protein